MKKLHIYLFRRNDRVHQIKRKSKISATNFRNRRWQLLTSLEQMSGFWPRQSKLKKYPLELFHAFILLTAFLAVGNKWREYVGTGTNMTIECSILILIYLAFIVKLALATIHQNKRQKVYESIIKHFDTIRDPEEADVLKKGAEGGFKYTLVYICIMSAVLDTFIGVPVLRAFNDYLFNHREFKMQSPLPINFGFDPNEYWYIITIDFIAWCYSALTVEFAYNLSYILQVRHAAALFKIVRNRLEKASELAGEFESGTMSDDAADQSHSLITSAINLHWECFKVVDLIEKSYSLTWFIILLLSTGGFGAGLHLLSTKFDDPIEIFRYATVFTIILLHFQIVFSEGQLIIDSAESVSDACCECKWYGLPRKSCNLLLMIMIRTSIPCQLTGAKLFPLSMETFSKMLKAALSYYTVFRAKCR